MDVCVVLFDPHLELLALTLSGLENQQCLGAVRIHDNGGTLCDGEVLAHCPPALHAQVVLSSSENVGFAAGQNRLVADSFAAGASHALVLNPDLRLEDTALADLLATSGELDDRHLVSGVILLAQRDEVDRPFPTREVVDSAGTRWTSSGRHLDVAHGQPWDSVGFTSKRRTSALTGALILVPRRAWSRIVGLSGEFFDEDFFAYREDAELGLRARSVGVACFVAPQVVGLHFRGTPGVTRVSPVVNRLGVQNRFLMRYRTGAVNRPGNLLVGLARDLGVIAAVHVRERDSLGGLRNARRLRSSMLDKRRQLAAAVERPRARSAEATWDLRARELGRYDARAASPDVWVVIPAHNPGEALVASVRLLVDDFCVVVVDDGSTEAFEWSRLDRAAVLRSVVNVGIASALNIGLSYALSHGAQVLVMLDQDSRLTPDGVRHLVDDVRWAAPGELRVVGPGRVGHLSYGHDHGSGLVEVPELLQSGMTLGREVLEQCGLMDESLVIDGVDTDFCLRVRRHGHRVLADLDVGLEHQLGGSAPGPARRIGPFRPLVTHHSATRRYYINRNRIRLLGRYALAEPRWAALTIRRTLVANLMAATAEQQRRAKARAILTGVRDGLLGRSGPRS